MSDAGTDKPSPPKLPPPRIQTPRSLKRSILKQNASNSKSSSFLGRSVKMLGSATRTGLAVVGFVSLVPLIYSAIETAEKKEEKEGKRGILVLPFHRMQIVEKRTQSKASLIKSIIDLSSKESDGEKIIEMEVRELVDIIHEAAKDPKVVALYGNFGGSESKFTLGGLAHAEEIRNAIRVFNQSHQSPSELNTSNTADQNTTKGNSRMPKKTYAYGESFTTPENYSFFVAAEFQTIQMQTRGLLNLSGLCIGNSFFRGFLDKYGIKAHVFKHGQYKNFPNSFTDKGFNNPHLKSTKSLLASLEGTVCSGINSSRGIHEMFDDRTWRAVRDYGSLTTTNAKELGLIDFHPPQNPLDYLIASKDKSDNSEQEPKKLPEWLENFDTRNFKANHAIDLVKYSKQVQNRKKKKLSMLDIQFIQAFVETVEKVTGTSILEKPALKEKIALLNVDGSINESMANSLIAQIKKANHNPDVKCIILRVNSPGGSAEASENILMECKDSSKPIIASMGNVCASGGYYVASGCDKIFAMPSTITGSIGVFNIKLDLTDLAKQYGIKVEYVSSGSLSSMNSPFEPLTKKMEKVIWRDIDDVYVRFKNIVSTGRGIPIDEVEDVAQGRVWTGEQAKTLGLVDEMGGINHVISYAKRTYASSDDSEILVLPKRLSFFERILDGGKGENKLSIWNATLDIFESESVLDSGYNHNRFQKQMMTGLLQNGSSRVVQNFIKSSKEFRSPGIMLAMDEDDALNFYLQELLYVGSQ